jgi:hypothetical protein
VVLAKTSQFLFPSPQVIFSKAKARITCLCSYVPHQITHCVLPVQLRACAVMCHTKPRITFCLCSCVPVQLCATPNHALRFACAVACLLNYVPHQSTHNKLLCLWHPPSSKQRDLRPSCKTQKKVYLFLGVEVSYCQEAYLRMLTFAYHR